MPKCVPMREMKDTAAFTKLVEEANGPVIVTKNGREALVVMTNAAYDALQDELAKTRLYARIAQAELELATGQYVEGTGFILELKEKYGL